MKKFGFATVAASGLVAAVIGLAAPAQAGVSTDAAPAALSASQIATGIDHHVWLDQITPDVNVPRVDTTVHQSR